MGRPLVTLAGDRHATRVGASLLHAIGHGSWVTRSAMVFTRIVIALAAKTAELAQMRQDLRRQMTQSVLMDHAGQAPRFLQALHERAQQRGPAPPPAAA